MFGIIEKIKNLPVHMDFDGQRKAERIFQTIILIFAGVGLVVGYIFQQFSFTVYILGIGFLLSCILTLPPWPMYRQKPLHWQKPREDTDVAKAKKKK
ncbi:signal peptidase complex subunit 1-like [Argiope bruennichi]|uniref:Signal peptidase complex subunit 1 n=1 Tax=Argiope bruennichi TaxID=94029 RepID=A0A8T0FAV2_ARGBR|nr:signal peptidase complex subunit 1-like [Argiope bruennichi]KAF8786559.1 Signal peptidase complex subunit 1 like protein [Argiope bruennichi]